MKSLTKSIRSKLVSQDVHAHFSLPVANVLREVRRAFFGLCINAGKAVLGAMMEAERTALCGPPGRSGCRVQRLPRRSTRSSVVLGGRRIAIARPRARAVQGAELTLPSFTWAAHEDPLNAATKSAIAAQVSTRRYQSTLDPLPAGEAQSAVSRSSVSRRLVALSAERLRAGYNFAVHPQSMDDLPRRRRQPAKRRRL